MYFIGGGLGGFRGHHPRAAKNPLTPPPQSPPLIYIWLWGVLGMISDFRETPPPGWEPRGMGWLVTVGGATTVPFTTNSSPSNPLRPFSVLVIPAPHLSLLQRSNAPKIPMASTSDCYMRS